MLQLEAPYSVPKEISMDLNAPSLVMMATPCVAQTEESARKIQLRQWVSGLGMRQSVNVSKIMLK